MVERVDLVIFPEIHLENNFFSPVMIMTHHIIRADRDSAHISTRELNNITKTQDLWQQNRILPELIRLNKI